MKIGTRLAFIGPPGTGKTTIAKAWLDRHRVNDDDHRPLLLSFSAALKWELAEMLAHVDPHKDPVDFFRAQTEPATKDAFRSLQQALGHFRRQEEPNYWLGQILRIIRDASQHDLRDGQTTFMAVDDCRFPNEEAALRTHGFLFVSLLPGETTRPLTAEQAADESEQWWPKFHADIVLPYRKGPDEQAALLEDILKGVNVDDFLS